MDDTKVSLSPEPAPGAPAFMADTEVREDLNADGSVRLYRLVHPVATVQCVDLDQAVADLGQVLEARAAAAAGHGAQPGTNRLEHAKTGMRYRVSFDDCCAQGSFTAAASVPHFDEDGEIDSVTFDNGVTLGGRGVRLEELDG